MKKNYMIFNIFLIRSSNQILIYKINENKPTIKKNLLIP